MVVQLYSPHALMLHPFEIIWYDDETREYLRDRPDDVGNELHPISLGAAVDLSNQLRRYEDDARKEHNPRLK